MSARLQDLREAITTAQEDRDECLRLFRPVIRGTRQMHLVEQYARLEADVHELDLLRKRELDLLVHGQERPDEMAVARFQEAMVVLNESISDAGGVA